MYSISRRTWGILSRECGRGLEVLFETSVAVGVAQPVVERCLPDLPQVELLTRKFDVCRTHPTTIGGEAIFNEIIKRIRMIHPGLLWQVIDKVEEVKNHT